MSKILLVFFASLSLNLFALPGDLERRVLFSRKVLEDRMRSENPIPRYVLDEAQCIASIRYVKAGFIFGGEGGNGLVSCRLSDGWSTPSFIRMGGPNVGLHAGVEVLDTVLVFTSPLSRRLIESNTVKLGVDVSAAVGPLGEGTGVSLPLAGILSYSFSKGVYVGASLHGLIVAHSRDRNYRAYGKDLLPYQILNMSGTTTPQLLVPYTSALEQYCR